MSDYEDVELNRWMKAALESRGEFAYRRPRTVYRWLKWSATILIAASFAVVLLMPSMSVSATSSVVDAIGLLSAADGVEMAEIDPQSPGELLLAWQDVPYTDSLAL